MGSNVNHTTWTKDGHTRHAYSPAESQLLAEAGWVQFDDNAGAKKSKKVVDVDDDTSDDEVDDDDTSDDDDDDDDAGESKPVKASAKKSPAVKKAPARRR